MPAKIFENPWPIVCAIT